jgi:hypothetical protein
MGNRATSGAARSPIDEDQEAARNDSAIASGNTAGGGADKAKEAAQKASAIASETVENRAVGGAARSQNPMSTFEEPVCLAGCELCATYAAIEGNTACYCYHCHRPATEAEKPKIVSTFAAPICTLGCKLCDTYNKIEGNTACYCYRCHTSTLDKQEVEDEEEEVREGLWQMAPPPRPRQMAPLAALPVAPPSALPDVGGVFDGLLQLGDLLDDQKG